MKSFAEVNQLLSKYIPTTGFTKAVYTLNRMKQLMDFLGNPQERYQVIHVAGTSGKTSTSYYIAALFGATGKKVGLTVSPYIDEINERVQINLEPLPEDSFVKNFDEFIQIVNTSDIHPTYFELVVAFAYWYFARVNVDYAVIETGLGGLLDGTNVVVNPNKVSVITDIGYDHTQILGSTLEKIAGQKAGIIHPRNEVFYLQQPEVITEIFKQAALKNHASVHELTLAEHCPYTEDLPGFQKRNWYLAFCVYKHVSKIRLDENHLRATTKLSIPGRMEVMSIAGKTIILDAAHNQQKMQALVKSIKISYPDQPLAVLFCLTEKPVQEVGAILKELLPITSHLIITKFKKQQDLIRRSQSTASISKACDAQSFHDYETETSSKTALQILLNRPETILVVTGSIYLLGDVRNELLSRD